MARDVLPYYVEAHELPPHPHRIEEFSHPRQRRSLLVGGVSLAAVLAAGVTYVMIESEKSVAMPPIVAADPANLVPAATPADNDQRESLIDDHVYGVQSAEQMELVTPGNGKVAEVPSSSGDDSNPISRVIGSAIPGPSLGGGAAAAADAPPVPVVSARVPIPRIKPAVFPTKAGKPQSTPAAAASSGGLY
jgi:hypothetical protein